MNDSVTHSFLELKPNDVDSVMAVTSDGGPWAEDLHFVINGRGGVWVVPNSQGDQVLEWLKQFDSVDYEQVVMASLCVERRTFLLWRKSGPPVLSEGTRKKLRSRFEDFLRHNFSGNGTDFAAVAQDVLARYDRPERAYHNLTHLAHLFWELDAVTEPTLDRGVIELALWYHDVIHIPKSKTNEEDSVRKLFRDLGDCRTRIDLAKVQSFILASKHVPKIAEPDPDLGTFLDLDLSILGQSPVDYDLYAQNVRWEYGDVHDLVYCYFRKKFLRAILSGAIFHTPWFRSRYEEAARLNIRGELNQWRYRLLPVI